MKKTRTLALVALLFALGFAACKKIKESLFPAFDADIQNVSLTIPITLAGAEASSTATVAFSLDSVIKQYTSNTFGFNSVSSVKVKDATVFLENADDQNDVSNFQNVSLKFASNTNTTPVEVLSASIPDSPATDANIPATNSPELKSYLNGTQLTYIISGTARRSTTKELNATVAVTLSVK